MTDRDLRIAGRLGTPLGSERAAADRNWRALSAAIAAPARHRGGPLRAAATTLALAVVVLAALGWWQGARIDVAGDRLPVLYREEVARTTIAADGVEGTLAIQQKHILGDARLRVLLIPRADAIVEVQGRRAHMLHAARDDAHAVGEGRLPVHRVARQWSSSR